jgi:hypothetical protein
VRLIAPDVPSPNPLASVDFTLVSHTTRGSILYTFEPSLNDRMLFSSDGVGVMAMSKNGLIVNPNLASTIEAESCLQVAGSMANANPATMGVHMGLVSLSTEQMATLVLVASAKVLGYSRLDFTYTSQGTAPTLRLLVNHDLGRA